MSMWEAFDYKVRITYRNEAESVNFVNRKFLSHAEIALTQANYEMASEHYGCVIEESPLGEEYLIDYFIPFIKSMNQNDTKSKRVFNIGTGFGLVNVFIVRLGYELHAIDSSKTMVFASYLKFIIADESTMKLGVPIHAIFDDSGLPQQFTQASLTDLPDTFAEPNSLGGILVDSALQHVNHDDVYVALKQWQMWLEPGGTLLFRLKVTDHGNAYVIHDEVGTRYYTSWTQQEIDELLEFTQKLGFTIQQQQEVPHKDVVAGTPPFYQIILIKEQQLADTQPSPSSGHLEA